MLILHVYNYVICGIFIFVSFTTSFNLDTYDKYQNIYRLYIIKLSILIGVRIV